MAGCTCDWLLVDKLTVFHLVACNIGWHVQNFFVGNEIKNARAMQH